MPMHLPQKSILTDLVIETERLRVCCLQTSDAELIFNLLNSVGWLRFIGDRNIHTLEDAANYIETLNQKSNIVYWKVVENSTGNKLGIITLVKRDFLTHADIGFAFLPEYMGKGFACEATKAVLGFLFEHQIETMIMAITVSDNVPSIKLLEKLGMQHVYDTTQNGEALLVYQLSNQ